MPTTALNHRGICAILGSLLLIGAPSAEAQIWIGTLVRDNDRFKGELVLDAEDACMTGHVPFNAAQIHQFADMATSVMGGYWRAVAAGGPRDISPAFHGRTDALWRDGNTQHRVTRSTMVTDRFAVVGARIDPKALWLNLSGDGMIIRGVWQVHGADGAPIGAYELTFHNKVRDWLRHSVVALFGRKPDWALASVELAGGEAVPVEPAQYCHTVGDVAPYTALYSNGKKRLAKQGGTSQSQGTAILP